MNACIRVSPIELLANLTHAGSKNTFDMHSLQGHTKIMHSRDNTEAMLQIMEVDFGKLPMTTNSKMNCFFSEFSLR